MESSMSYPCPECETGTLQPTPLLEPGGPGAPPKDPKYEVPSVPLTLWQCDGCNGQFTENHDSPGILRPLGIHDKRYRWDEAEGALVELDEGELWL